MTNTARSPIAYRGRIIGIVALVVAQFLVGLVHAFFGFWLFLSTSPKIEPFSGILGPSPGPEIYSIYTVVFGLLTLFFAVPLWLGKRWGWIGTNTVLFFVIIADSLTLLDLPSIPGIPKFAGFGEITYSVLVVLYLLQGHIRTKYQIHF